MPAAAEIARPPGANPSNRGYELVSLADAQTLDMLTGTASSFTPDEDINREARPAFRLPAVSRAGDAAIVSSQFAMLGQPARGSNSIFRSARQPSGEWTQTFAFSPQRPQPTSGLLEAWTPDLATVAWSTDEPKGDKAISADGRTITYQSNPAGTPRGDVYQRTDGGPDRRVNETTAGSVIANPTLEAVAPDAARVAFSADDGTDTGTRLFLRDGATTLPVDTPRQTLTSPRTTSRFVSGTPDFRTGSDLSTVFFVSRDRLVPGDENDDADLYRWTEQGNDLQLVSAGTGTSCPDPLPRSQIGDDVRGCDVAFGGASPDNRVVYFLSTERLAGAAEAQPGLPNVYYRSAGGPITYALTLEAYNFYASTLAPRPPLGGPNGRIEDDGSFLVSTGRDPVTGAPYDTSQIVRFDPGSSTAVCISCAADGGSRDVASLGALLGGDPPGNNSTADGRYSYFDAEAQLVPEDRDSTRDVYQYDAVTGERTLISPAQSRESTFVGVSADGADVMFDTRSQLVARDQNGLATRVYDARRGGGEQAPAPAAAPCGDACRAPAPAPPSFVPGNSALAGLSTGNVGKQVSVRVTLASLSAGQRRAVARSGRLTAVVAASAATTVRVEATARVGRATATIASGSVRLRRGGRARVTLRLSAAARRALRSKRSLRVTLTASAAGGAASKKTVTLIRAQTTSKAGAR